MMPLLTVAVLFVWLTLPAMGATVAVDTTWEGAVRVSETVTVAPGATLTVAPGGEVRFAAGAGLVVRGALVANRRSGKGIVLRGEGQAGAWEGVVIAPEDAGQPASHLVGCTITGAVNGVVLRGTAASPHLVKRCRISGCSLAGMRLEGVTGAIVEGNEITDCGTPWVPDSGQQPTESGGIWVDGARECFIRRNVIRDCREYGIRLGGAEYCTLQGNAIRRITGDHMKLHGMGLVGTRAARNLVLGNTITDCTYLLISFGAGCHENLIADNDLARACDAINFTAGDNWGNVARGNRVADTWWSQLYVTSEARDNRFENCDVTGGGGWAATNNCAGITTFEDCDFRGTYPINVWGYGGAVFRRCKLYDHLRDYDLHLTHNARATLVDCVLDRARIWFGEGTANNEHSRVIWQHEVTVAVRSEESGQPLFRAVVTATAGDEVPVVARTESDGRARLELTECVIRAEGSRDVTPHRLVVQAEGYEALELKEVQVRQAMSLEARLKPTPKEQ